MGIRDILSGAAQIGRNYGTVAGDIGRAGLNRGMDLAEAYPKTAYGLGGAAALGGAGMYAAADEGEGGLGAALGLAGAGALGMTPMGRAGGRALNEALVEPLSRGAAYARAMPGMMQYNQAMEEAIRRAKAVDELRKEFEKAAGGKKRYRNPKSKQDKS